MTIASRTPEGYPSHCPMCGRETALEFSSVTDDATCPHCGCLLWKANDILLKLQAYVKERTDIAVTGQTSLDSVADESLEIVELLMALEDEFDLDIPNEDYDQLRTIADLIRYIERRQSDE